MKGRSNRSSGNKLRLLTGGEELFTVLFQLIDQAKTFIHIQVYILADDTTGRQLCNKLLDAAARGVKVYLMMDNFGSSAFPKKIEEELRKAGIVFKRFSKNIGIRKLKIGRRLHSKIVVIDNRYAMVGGMNFADRYSGFDGKRAWLDFALLAEGPAAAQLNRMASVYWKRVVRRTLTHYDAHAPVKDGKELKWVVNDRLRNRFQVSHSYRFNLSMAEKEIWIVASYFIPGARMIRILKKRAAAGVKIHLVLSRESDVPFIKKAMEYYYSYLLKQGIAIYEWTPSVLHAKLAIADGKWISIGSYNLNQLSDWGSLEANAETSDRGFISEVRQKILTEVLEGCEIVQARKYLGFSPFASISQTVSFFLVRTALRVLLLGNRR